VIGGYSRWAHDSFIRLLSYDMKTNIWLALKNMNHPRHNFGFVELDGKIYVAGGWSRDEGEEWFGRALKSVEVYDTSKNTWTLLQSMQSKRAEIRMSVHAGLLYVFGGKADKDAFPLNSVECYSPIDNRWTYKNSMPYPASVYGLVKF